MLSPEFPFTFPAAFSPSGIFPVRTGISSDIHKFLNIFPHNVVFQIDRISCFFFKSVVSSPVCGITDTEKFLFVTAATVRLIPSMQIDPFPRSDPGSYPHMRL